MVILFSLLSLIATIASLFMGGLVYTRNPRNQVNVLFLILCLTASYAAFSEFAYRSASDPAIARIWIIATFLMPLQPPVLLLHFSIVFSGHLGLLKRHKFLYVLMYGPAVILGMITLLTNWRISEPVLNSWGWTIQPSEGPMMLFTTIYFGGAALLALYLCLERFLRTSQRIQKKQAQYALIGFAFPVVTAVINESMLPALGIRLVELSNISFGIFSVGLIGFAIMKYQMFQISTSMAADDIIATMADMLFLIDRDGHIVIVNEACERALGYPHNQLIGCDVDEIFDSDEEPVCKKILAAEYASGINGIETHFKTYTGESLPVSLSCSLLRDAGQQLLGSVCVGRDITEQKEVEEVMASQREHLSARYAEMKTLYKTSIALTSGFDIKKVLDEVLEDLLELDILSGDGHRAGVFTCEGDDLRLLVQKGAGPEFVAMHDGMKIGTCLCGISASEGRVILSRSSARDVRHTLRDSGEIDHGHIIVPLKSGQEVIGVLYTYTEAGASIDNKSVQLLESIGNQVGMAISNARLFSRMEYLSMHDPLTGLANRHVMDMQIGHLLSASERSGASLSVAMMDIDHFKDYNDSFGHESGDLLLKKLGKIVATEIRGMDVAVRYGGEEFLLLLPDTTLPQAVEMSERLRARIMKTPFALNEEAGNAHITVSIGLASTVEAGIDRDRLLVYADKAMYRAKENGRNRVEAYQIDSGT